MQVSIQHRSIPLQAHRQSICVKAAASVAVALLASTLLPAQTSFPMPKRSGQAHPPVTPQTQPVPSVQPKPDWPINDQPKPATILWNKDELRIDAANSSLQQIMDDVASATGASLDGFSKDERVFGDYGPAPARDVLTQLLQGTGYNIVMVGDQGQGAPRQIFLSARNTNPVPQNNSRPTQEEEEEVAPEPQYEPPPQNEIQRPIPPQAMRPGFNPGAPGTYMNQQPGQVPQQQGQPIQQPQMQPQLNPANPNQ